MSRTTDVIVPKSTSMASKQKDADRPVMPQKETKERNPSNFQALGQLRACSDKLQSTHSFPHIP